METLQILKKLFWPIFSSTMFVLFMINDSYGFVSYVYLHPKTWELIFSLIFLVSIIRILFFYIKEHESLKEQQNRYNNYVGVIFEKVRRLDKRVKELRTKPPDSHTIEAISQDTNAISQAMQMLNKDIEVELKKPTSNLSILDEIIHKAKARQKQREKNE